MEIKEEFKALNELVTPLSEGKASSLEHILEVKTRNLEVLHLDELKNVDEFLEDGFNLAVLLHSPWVRFLRVLLHKLIRIRNLKAVDEELLISLSQQKTLKLSIEMIVCCGILSHLNKGIGVPIKQRICNEFHIQIEEQETEKKQYLLNFSVYGLMNLWDSKLYQSILISKHLGDLIAANIQLILEKQAVDSKLCSVYLKKLIEDTYQPSIIRELMVMLGNKDIPKKLHRWLSNTLSVRLIAKDGLIATLRAILDLTGDSKDNPRYWDHVSVLAKLLTIPKHAAVYPQILELLKGQSHEYKQVAVMCIKLLSESRTEECEKFFISPLLYPIMNPCKENECSLCLQAIHSCIGISAPWTVPPHVFKHGYIHLLRLHSKTRSSISYLKSKIADIAHSILADERTDMKKTFDAALFETLNVDFHLGAEGGIYTDVGLINSDPESEANSLLELVLTRDDPTLKVKFFKMLIESIVEFKELYKQIIYTKLLSELCNDSDVQNYLGQDPYCLVPFIKQLLVEHERFDNQTVTLGLMILGVIISTPIVERPLEWNVFKCLIEPLKNFKSSNCETNVLANELYELILSHGVIKKKAQKTDKPRSSLTKALEEVVDPLLPVRAHGLRELTKLIKAKDQPTLQKKESILFIFKENLKDDDSYVYLAAVDGLASLASSFPDEVLTTLIDEYISTKHCTETRLKVGEVLLKIGRFLNEMAVVYKKELISCFLIGCRDEDELMRASSLSNLGELAKILSFRITSFIIEILECIKAIYETDKFPEPRRAAVMVLTLLIRGLGEGVLNTLQDVLLDIYRSLKHIYEYDKDDITRLHAQMALEELRASTIVFLFPVKPLEKRIFVLDPPE